MFWMSVDQGTCDAVGNFQSDQLSAFRLFEEQRSFLWGLQRPGFAPKMVLMADIDEAGRLARIYTVLASRKLARVH
jgi:hypothetical protein